MKSPRRLELLFAGILAVSLAAKGATNVEARPADQAHLAKRLETLLGSAGLRVDRPRPFANAISISARGKNCEVWAAEYLPHGTAADIIAVQAREVGPLRFSYRGRSYAQPPRMRALMSFYLWREARRLGVPAKRHPIIAVAASSGCELDRLDWQQISKLDR